MTTLREVKTTALDNLLDCAREVELSMQQIQRDYTQSLDCVEQFAKVQNLLGAMALVDLILDGDVTVGVEY